MEAIPIQITGLFQPSGGPGSFDLYQPEDIQAGDVDVALQAISGGQFLGGSHATAPVGEVVVQRRTTTGAPTHSATEVTPCWNTVDNDLYVNNDGSTGWELIANSADAYSHPNHTGDVTSVGDGATTIAANAVTFAKMQTVSANILLGNDATGTAVEEITCTAFARTILDDADAGTARTTLGLGTIAVENTPLTADLGGTENDISGFTGSTPAPTTATGVALMFDSASGKVQSGGLSISGSSTTPVYSFQPGSSGVQLTPNSFDLVGHLLHSTHLAGQPDHIARLYADDDFLFTGANAVQYYFGGEGPAQCRFIKQFHFSGIISPAQITSNQDGYAPVDDDESNVWRLSSDASREIQGIEDNAQAGDTYAGQFIALFNIGSNDIVLKDETATVDDHKIAIPNGDMTLGADEGIAVWYDNASDRWRPMNTAIPDSAVTYARIQDVSGASLLLGRGDSGSGVVQEITLGTNLSMSGTTLLTGNETITLSGDVGGSGTTSITTTIQANAVEYSMLQQSSATGFAIIAKVSTGAGNYAELNAGTDSVLRRDGSGNLAFGTIDSNHISGITALVQGDIIYGSGTDTLALLNKNASATRYLSNTGASNNPAWAQVDLTNGVTGVLPDANVANDITLDNITQITTRSHTSLSDIGTNTHAQIDTHISNSAIHGTHPIVLTSDVSGILPVGNGGTGVSSITANALITGNGASAVSVEDLQYNGTGTLARSSGDLTVASGASSTTYVGLQAGNVNLGIATEAAERAIQPADDDMWRLGTTATNRFSAGFFLGDIEFEADNIGIKLGTSDDDHIYHDGTNLFLDAANSVKIDQDVKIAADDKRLYFGASDDSYIEFDVDGGVNGLVVNPDNVGSGGMSVHGRLWVGGQLNLTRNYTTEDLTISGGTITLSGASSLVYVDTESAASTDDLDKISGGKAGDIIIVAANNTTRTVVVKDDNDFLKINGGDFSLANTESCIWLLCASESPSSKWVEIGRVNFV